MKQLDMVIIPKGHFIMGSIPTLDQEAFDEETPMHIIYLTDYYLSCTPITNDQYALFIAATHYSSPEGWHGKVPPHGKERHPVVNVNWEDSSAYCRWLSTTTGDAYRLPSEAEWEKGARGVNALVFPWGNAWEPYRCNTLEADLRSTVSVDNFQKGNSPYGLLDMAGNIFEWTNTLWQEEGLNSNPFRYPYDPDDGREVAAKNERAIRIARGGSFLRNRRYARCSSRMRFRATTRNPDTGFRVAMESRY
jgi:toxoflavin biosynthesis protein ToxD